MLDSTQFLSSESQTTAITCQPLRLKQSCDNEMHSPTPVKRKTCILKSWHQNEQVRGPIVSRSYNKLEEFIKRETSYPTSPFKTEKKIVDQAEYFQDQSFSKMIKSDQLFDKKKANIKELRNQIKNPLGKEDCFPEKSFENLKFAKDSLSYFEDLERLNNEGEFFQNEDDFNLNEDLLVQRELELLKELSFDN